MKRLTSLLALLLLVDAAPSQPPPGIAALAQGVLDAANANSPQKLARLYTNDAVVVDENAPFVWHGPGAGAQWFTALSEMLAARHATLRAAGGAFGEFSEDREGDDAYLTQRLTIAVSTNGKAHTESGTQTYVFHKTSDGWKISRQIWTTSGDDAPPVPAPLDVTSVTQTMMADFNKHAPSVLPNLYANDAIFSDDLPQFSWSGATAGAQWYAAAAPYLAAHGISGIRGTMMAPFEYRERGGAAYLIATVRWSGTMDGKPFAQLGTYTFTMRSVDGQWRITSQTWLSH